MNSVTKRELSQKQINKMVLVAFGEKVEIQSVVELTDGYFNNSYLIEIQNENSEDLLKIVLKVAPKNEVQILSYEEGLMEIEVAVLREYKKLGMRVPKVIFYDDSCEVIDSEYFFMSYMDGVPLDKVRKQCTNEQYEKLSQDLAKDLLKSKDSVGICFGLPKISDKIYENWYECFRFMVLELIEDAKKINLQLPKGLNEQMTIEMLEEFKEDLMQVEYPILIHKDIWEGNIFVDKDTYEYVGMIDCERAIYADPLLEVVCGFLDENKIFMNTYYGKTHLSKSEMIRVELYKFYLYLLMVVEGPYRQYNNIEHEKWTKNMLTNVIRGLKER